MQQGNGEISLGVGWVGERDSMEDIGRRHLDTLPDARLFFRNADAPAIASEPDRQGDRVPVALP